MTLKVLETQQSFQRKVIAAICEKLALKFLLISKEIRDSIAKDFKPVFTDTSEYSLLTTDSKIRGDTGLRKGTEIEVLDKVIQRICDSIVCEPHLIHPVGNQINGGFSVGIVLADFSDILALPEAEIKSKNGINKWLEWIVKNGGKIAVNDYHVVYGKGGRSGQAVMVMKGVWRVDDKISSSANDHWLTRALTHNRVMIEKIILNAVETSINRIL